MSDATQLNPTNTTQLNPIIENQLNPQQSASNETQINSANAIPLNPIHTTPQPTSATQLNPHRPFAVPLQPGHSLCGKYTIIRSLDTSSSEADLYLCEYCQRQYIAKIYRRKAAIKPEISRKLMQLVSPYIVPICETGDIQGYHMEILPYYQSDSLQGRTYSYHELKTRIIPSLNEGLHVLHENGILHKDLKPSNIMLSDSGQDIAIIDFGISSLREADSTVIVTKTGMTPEYSAPETFRSLFLEESDYYSLGITIYELFCGHTPYYGMDAEEIEQYSIIQRVPFPQNMPQDLQNLIAACTYYDITNRRNTANPNRRWTYEEVRNWCAGISQDIPGEGVGNGKAGDITPYSFQGKVYTEAAELANALARHWDEGKKQLFRGILSAFFKQCNPQLAGCCMDAEEEAARTPNQKDHIFFRLLYKLNPETIQLYWKGRIYPSLSALGSEMLQRLRTDSTELDNYYDSLLNERLLSRYLAIKAEKNRPLATAIAALEDGHYAADTPRDKKKNRYLTAYLLSGQKILKINGRQYKTAEELTAELQTLLNTSYAEFEALCLRLIDSSGNLDIQFESWLLALGKGQALAAWRKGEYA